METRPRNLRSHDCFAPRASPTGVVTSLSSAGPTLSSASSASPFSWTAAFVTAARSTPTCRPATRLLDEEAHQQSHPRRSRDPDSSQGWLARLPRLEAQLAEAHPCSRSDSQSIVCSEAPHREVLAYTLLQMDLLRVNQNGSRVTNTSPSPAPPSAHRHTDQPRRLFAAG